MGDCKYCGKSAGLFSHAHHGLRNDCQDIAKRYWSRANISDFEEASPIYRIEYVNP